MDITLFLCHFCFLFVDTTESFFLVRGKFCISVVWVTLNQVLAQRYQKSANIRLSDKHSGFFPSVLVIVDSISHNSFSLLRSSAAQMRQDCLD